MTLWHGLLRRWDVRLSAGVLVAVVLACLLAPVYARDVAGVDPFDSNIAGHVVQGGRAVDIMQPNDNRLHLGLTPVGPQWRGAYCLGADGQGRDVAARLLYGGRNSLLISACAAVLCLVVATVFGVCAGFFGGFVDMVLSRLLDIFWAVPVYLFAISLSIVTIGHGLRLGPVTIAANNLLIPIGIIATVYMPYAARPIRARTMALARMEFVTVARGYGASGLRIVLREIVPNLFDTLVVLAPLVMALSLLAESALSFLALGVQAPAASWGSIIRDGEGLLYTRPLVAVAPGIAIVLVVLALNMLGDALRAVLDPRDGGGR